MALFGQYLVGKLVLVSMFLLFVLWLASYADDRES